VRPIPRLLLAILFVCVSAAASGCPGCDSIPFLSDPTPVVQSVSVTPPNMQLAVGQLQQFTAAVLPSSVQQSVTWSVAPASVATISATGVVTAISAGQATVTATTVAKPVMTSTAIVTVTAPSAGQS